MNSLKILKKIRLKIYGMNCMKKLLVFIIMTFCFISPVLSRDTLSEDYLKNKKHFFSMSFLGENAVEKVLKHALKKEAPGDYKVNFKGYTLSSLKEGIFKYLEVTGKDVTAENIEIPYFNIKTVTDYNWIDYNQNPIVYKSDMEFDFVAHLSDKSINNALETEEYKKVLNKVSQKAYPIFTLNKVNVKLKNDKMYIIMSYNFPITPRAKDKTFVVSTGLHIVDNEIKTCNVLFDSLYGNLPQNKVVNLVNLVDPLNYLSKQFKIDNGEVKINEIKIEDDIVVINGKIFIKGENK